MLLQLYPLSQTATRVEAEREAKLQTDRRCKRRPNQEQKQWDPGRLRGTQTAIVEFFISTHRLRQQHTDCWPPSADGLNCLVIATTQPHRLWTKTLKWSRRQGPISLLPKWSKACLSSYSLWLPVKLATERSRQPTESKNLHASARQQIAEEWFHLKSNEENPGGGLQSGFAKHTNGNKWDTLRWQGSTALHSGYKKPI